jgi:hypothetical protein
VAAKKKAEKRLSKLNVWLKHYLNDQSPTTFLNKTESTRQAGYRCPTNDAMRQRGCRNFNAVRHKIKKWLDENGLSEAALKTKLLSLLHAKESKFFSAPVKDEKTGIVTDIFVKEIVVDALEIQRRTLDMALKVQGMYAPEKWEHTGKDGEDLFKEVRIIVVEPRKKQIKLLEDYPAISDE